jgi:AraC-like DNA-binding protein/mannose-6-phosphate isomerase-like protein (cupin superfamily)
VKAAAAHDARLSLPRLSMREDFGTWHLHGQSCGSCAFDAASPTNHPHYHTCYELCLVFAGSGRFAHGDDAYDIRAGDVFVADPGVLHEISSFETLDLDLVFFQFELVDKRGRGEECDAGIGSFALEHRTVASKQEHLLHLLSAINAHMTHPGRRHWLKPMARQLLLEALESLAERALFASEEGEDGLARTVERAAEYIRLRARERIRLDEVAEVCGTSVRNLQLLFRQQLESTVIGHVNTERMRVAANDLLMGYRVGEVAERVGVPSPEQFSRLFKKHHGISPKRYQMERSPGRAGYGTTFRLKGAGARLGPSVAPEDRDA